MYYILKAGTPIKRFAGISDENTRVLKDKVNPFWNNSLKKDREGGGEPPSSPGSQMNVFLSVAVRDA
jgi:hypothetical protein